MDIIRPSPEIVAAKKRAIAARYRDKAKRAGKQPVTFAAVRVAELSRLFERRYGRQGLPDADESVTAIRVMADHLGRLRDATRRIGQWLDRFAPWLDLASRERVIRDATERPLKYRADKLAWKLQVTAAERAGLGLRTIGAIDQTKAERAAIAKQRKRERDEARRRANGAKPRAEYEASSTTSNAPWLEIGISRRTYYRRLAQVRAPHI